MRVWRQVFVDVGEIGFPFKFSQNLTMLYKVSPYFTDSNWIKTSQTGY
jgi:hypothetical protein